MAQASILAPGATGADSTNVVVTAGATVSLGIYLASGELDEQAFGVVMANTPGVAIQIDKIDESRPLIAISGPGSFFIRRPSNGRGLSYGFFSDV